MNATQAKQADSLDGLQTRLGWRFRDASLLRRALTHSSAAASPGENNERLEFLGDRVLGLLAAEMLYRDRRAFREGVMAARLNAFVRKESCARIARAWGLWEHIRIGEGERKTADRSQEGILADACEAVLGALFLDGGMEAARCALQPHCGPLFADEDDIRDPKNALQEWLHRHGASPPTYRQIGRRGSDHAPIFSVEADAGPAGKTRAEGTSLRRAERQAAENLLAAVTARALE